MSRAADTLTILADGGGISVTVQAETFDEHLYSEYPVTRSGTWSAFESATVFIFPSGGESIKDGRGELVRSTHRIFFPLTSSVAVGHRIFENGNSDYHEVLRVDGFEDHNRIFTVKVGGR